MNLPKLYVDDIRECPHGWDIAIDYFQAIEMLQTTQYGEISLDHDLASYEPNGRERTGKDIVLILIDMKMNGEYVPHTIHVHSSNPVGAKRMREDIEMYLHNDYVRV